MPRLFRLGALFTTLALFPSCSTSFPEQITGPDSGATADDSGADASITLPPWLTSAQVFVSGHAADNIYLDCRTVICHFGPRAFRVSTYYVV